LEKPALEGGTPTRETFLPFARAWIDELEIQQVVDVLRSGWLTTGPKALEFEDRFREYIGCQEAIAVNSCTGALHIALTALGIGSGDEVITTPLTFAATANVCVLLGARPVLADIQEDTLNLDPEAVKSKVTKKTKAIIPVHYGGHPCDMDEIRAIADESHLRIVEDAAHAAGAVYRERKVGTLGDAGAFSFYATKNMTTGEGGMLTCDDSLLAEEMRKLRLHGISRDAWKRYEQSGSWFYEVERAGYKYNLTDLAAALGVAQLTRLDHFNDIRREQAQYLSARLKDLEGIRLPTTRPYVRHAWHLFPIRISPERLRVPRARFLEALAKENIGCSVHFIPLFHHPFYRNTFGMNPQDFPVTEHAWEGLVSLPIYPKMTTQDLDDVVHAVRKLHEFYSR